MQVVSSDTADCGWDRASCGSGWTGDADSSENFVTRGTGSGYAEAGTGSGSDSTY